MVNMDVGFDAMVTRDASGACTAAAHNFRVHVVDAVVVEAYALKARL